MESLKSAFLSLPTEKRVEFRLWLAATIDDTPAPEIRKIFLTQATISEILAAWNGLVGVIHVKALTDKRRAVLANRWHDEFWRVHWKEALAKVATIPGLLGKNDRGWRANWDWFMRSDTVVRLLEGGYDFWDGMSDEERRKARKVAADDAWMNCPARKD